MTTKAKVRLTSTDSTYTLTSADLDTFNALGSAQGFTGAAQSTVGQTQLFNFFGIVNDIAYDHYRLSTNAQLKIWLEAVFDVLIATKTNYRADAHSITGSGMYTLYMYYQFNKACMRDGLGWCCDDCNQKGFPLDNAQRGGKYPDFDSGGLSEASPWWFFASPWTEHGVLRLTLRPFTTTF